jgi:hypothetical protein
LDVTPGVKQYIVTEIPLTCFSKTCLAVLER